MQTLKQIWADYVQSEEYQTSPEFRYSIPAEQEQRLRKELGEKGFMMAEDVIMSMASEAEEKGFLQGFRMAMNIRNECIYR